MSWWQWLLAWFALSIVVAPIIGAILGRIARHYPEVPEPEE